MIVAVADDVTGAVEVAGIGWRHGFQVSLQRDLRAAPSATDLVVLDTDSRSLTCAEARQQVALAAAAARTAEWVYKKVDSVLRGHVRAECTELASVLGKTSVCLCPANPSLGRTIVDGCLRVAGVPLHETAFAHDPEWAATTDRVEELLSRSPGWPCRIDATAAHADEGRIAAGDVTSAGDLSHWAETVDSTVLPAGGGDFFEALLKRSGHREQRRPQWTVPSGLCLMVCGSTTATSRATVAGLSQAGVAVCDMPAELFTGTSDVAGAANRWSADLVAALARQRLAVMAIRHPVVAEPSLARHLAAWCAHAVRQVLRNAPVRLMLVEGGATAAAILEALGHARWELAGEIRRGVGVLRPRGLELNVVLKPGSYPWPEGILSELHSWCRWSICA